MAIPLPPGDDAGTVELRAKACTPVVIARHDTRMLVSGDCHGNTMCGSFGFWIVDAKSRVASPALTGCFAAVSAGAVTMRWRTLTLLPPMRIDGRPSCPARFDATTRRWRTRASCGTATTRMP